jgi:release factor glutamine methyltransferase
MSPAVNGRRSTSARRRSTSPAATPPGTKSPSAVEFIEGDLLASLPPDALFDIVVSNPPYVSRSEWEALKTDVRDHEPYQALVAGETGTEIIARLIPQAADRLRPGGWLLIEISPMIETAVTQLLQAEPRFDPPTIHKDTAHHPRIAQAQRNG